MLLPINVNQLSLIPRFFDVMCTFPPQKVISGYSEYANQMDADQNKLLFEVAQQVVQSFATDSPIVAIAVVGHADTAMRKPVKERASYEMDVSLQRAQAAKADLRTKIEFLGRGLDPKPIDIVKFRDPVGMGSTKKLISNPLTEKQMKLNRRVEIFLGQCFVPPQWTWRDAAQRGLALLADDTDAHKRIRYVLEKVLTITDETNTDIKDGYFDYQAIRTLVIPPGSTEEQKKEIFKKSTNHLVKNGGASGGTGDLKKDDFGPATRIPDDDFVKSLESIDEVITRSIRDFTLSAHQAGASDLIVRALKVIDAERVDPKSIYSCYASYHWGAK